MSMPVVAIDGPAGVGKTPVAGKLADALGIPRLDTGAMFRAIALNLGENGLNMNPRELRQALSHFDFRVEGCGGATRLLCNGIDPGAALRQERIGVLASTYATRPEVREFTLRMQQRAGSMGPIVAEGRDMGTVVFPTAAFKFFLDASPEVRAKRRWLELTARGGTTPLAEIMDKIIERDAQDRNRPIAPLKPADDAIIIDTSLLDPAQVLNALLDKIRTSPAGKVFPGHCHA